LSLPPLSQDMKHSVSRLFFLSQWQVAQTCPVDEMYKEFLIRVSGASVGCNPPWFFSFIGKVLHRSFFFPPRLRPVKKSFFSR